MTAVAARAQGKYERLWRERHARDLALSLRPEGHPKGFIYREEVGLRVVQFIEGYCRHHKGKWAGEKLVLEQWQREVICQIFGWLNADGTRRFRIAYIEVARKNGKSTLAGGLGLYLLMADGEMGAEVYSTATKKDQARIVWSDAAAMDKASSDLKKFARVLRSNISCPKTGSKFEPLGADSTTLDGLNPSGHIADELHAHKDRGVWDKMDTGMGAREQPLTVAITTAGLYDPESIGYQMHDLACKVLEGVVEDDSFFAVIFAADEGDDLFSEVAQKKANPNYGVSAKPEFLQKQAEKAKSDPNFFNPYCQLHLNIWTQQVKRWLQVDKWNECDPVKDSAAAVALSARRAQELRGKPCFGGLDLASKLDLAAFTLLFPLEANVVAVLAKFWLPEERVKYYFKRGHRHYKQWVEEGWIVQTPGNVIDYDFIKRDVVALSKEYLLKEIAFDPWNATQISTQLQGEGLVMVETRQGYKTLSEPSKDLEARVVEKSVLHSGNPVMRFCVSNAVVSTDSAGNIKPDKEKATDKIDGVVALIMSLSRFVLEKPAEAESYIERNDLVVLG